MKLITDEQYAAINWIASELNYFVKDISDETLLECYCYPNQFVEEPIKTALNIAEKSLKGEDWAQLRTFDEACFVTEREVQLELLKNKLETIIIKLAEKSLFSTYYNSNDLFTPEEFEIIKKLCPEDRRDKNE